MIKENKFIKSFVEALKSRQFSPEDLSMLKPKLDLDKSLINADAFTKYTEKRIVNISGFKHTDAPHIRKLLESTTDEGVNIKGQIEEYLKATDDFVKAQKSFENDMKYHQDMLAKIPDTYRPQTLLHVLKETTDSAVEAMKTQELKEINSLKTIFTEQPFNKYIEKEQLSSKQKTQLEESLLKQLETSHKERRETFIKSAEETQKKIHDKINADTLKVLFLASLAKHSEQMSQVIEAAIPKHVPTSSGLDKEINVNLSQVKIEGLKKLQRKGGQEVTITENGNTIFKLELGSRIANPLYYAGGNATKDIGLIAHAIRAKGHDKINMTLTFSNEKIALQRAQETFEACVMAGFPPEKISITVNINGKITLYKEATPDKKDETSKSFEELFQKERSKLNELKQQGEAQRKKYADLVSTKEAAPPKEIDEYKKTMSEIRKAQESKIAAPAIEAEISPDAPAL